MPTARSVLAALALAALAALVALVTLAPVTAHGADDADRDALLVQYAETRGFRLGVPAAVQVTDDGARIAFLRSGPRSFRQDLWVHDVAAGTERCLARADELAGGSDVGEAELARRERRRIAATGIAAFELVGDGGQALVPAGDRLWLVSLDDGAARELTTAVGAIDPRPSPDGRRVAFSRDREVWVLDVAADDARPLTVGAAAGITRGQAEFVAQEELDRQHGIWWSPDGSRLLYQETDERDVETFHRLDPTHPERAPRTARYPRPGRANASVRLGLVGAGGGPTTWVDPDAPFEYLARVVWRAESPPTLVVMNRRQTERRVMTVDPSSGAARTVHVETDPAWLENDPTMPVWVGPDRFLWTTDRRGAPQVELRGADGGLIAELTPPDTALLGVEGWNAGARALVVRRSADPGRSAVVALPLGDDEGFGAPRRLSPGDGVDDLASASRGTSRVVVVHRRPADGPRSLHVVDAGDGRELGRVASVAEEPHAAPRVEYLTVGDEPAFRAVIVRPRDFDPARRYPTLVHVYGGPTSIMAEADRRGWVADQWLADAGFIVVALDGRGTPGRGRDWLRAVRGDLVTIPLADQAAGVRLLGAREPSIDVERVGIYGWSFGGYVSAVAAIREPDTFHAAVAGAPVTDWRDYDTAYAERYLGVPGDIAGAYDGTSAVAEVGRLRRPLLLIHGTADDNVYFMHSAKLADAAFRAGAPLEFLPLGGFTHMVPDPQVTIRMQRRILRHFREHLGEPVARAGA